MKTITNFIEESSLAKNDDIMRIYYEDFYTFISMIINNVDEVSEKDASFLINFFDKKHPILKKWIDSNHNNELSDWMNNYL